MTGGATAVAVPAAAVAAPVVSASQAKKQAADDLISSALGVADYDPDAAKKRLKWTGLRAVEDIPPVEKAQTYDQYTEIDEAYLQAAADQWLPKHAREKAAEEEERVQTAASARKQARDDEEAHIRQEEEAHAAAGGGGGGGGGAEAGESQREIKPVMSLDKRDEEYLKRDFQEFFDRSGLIIERALTAAEQGMDIFADYGEVRRQRQRHPRAARSPERHWPAAGPGLLPSGLLPRGPAAQRPAAPCA